MTRDNPGRPRRDEGHPERRDSPLSLADDAILDTPFGREDDHGSIARTLAAEEIGDIDIGAKPVSETTDIPDPGTTTETVDGLDETEEAVRHMAEDVPSGGGRP